MGDETKSRSETERITAETVVGYLKKKLQLSLDEFYDFAVSKNPERIRQMFDRFPSLTLNWKPYYDNLCVALEQLKFVKETGLYKNPELKLRSTHCLHSSLDLLVSNIIDSKGIQKVNAEIIKREQEAKRLAKELQEQRDLLFELAYKDQLTGCWNRRHFMEKLQEETAQAYRHKHDLSLIVFDINDFKKVNDTWDHAGGDFVLTEVGNRARRYAHRDTDLVARLGGDEFAILLPFTKELGAEHIAEELLKDVRTHPFNYEGNLVPVSLSLGVAQYVPGEVPARLHMRADKCFYAAQTAGKACTITDTMFGGMLRDAERSGMSKNALKEAYRIRHPLLLEYYLGINSADLKEPDSSTKGEA
jgi:diguanylate cyclase (GGDEF)-like protein